MAIELLEGKAKAPAENVLHSYRKRARPIPNLSWPMPSNGIKWMIDHCILHLDGTCSNSANALFRISVTSSVGKLI
jgi:hypothetical protein